MRIAFATFSQETNGFCNVLVDLETMRKFTVKGEDMRRASDGAHTYLGGVYDEARERGVEIVFTRSTSLKPSGPCHEDAAEECLNEILGCLCREYEKEPYDGIILFMHGACATPNHPDVEGEILRMIREKLGYEIPIGMVLDLHGNITQEMADLSDVLIGCKCYPHIDEYEQGRRILALLEEKIRLGYKTYHRLVKLPWLMVPAQGLTEGDGPAGDVKRLTEQREREDPDLLQLSFFQGFPYSDVPASSVSFIAVAKTREAADRNALEVARYAWDRREDFKIPLYSAEEAVALALQAPNKPALVHESADNPGGGTAGDGTDLLRELLRVNVPAAFGFIFDPEVAELAKQAGVGNRITCLLGGKTDKLHGEPIALKDAYVRCVSDGRFIRKSTMGLGGKNSLGTTVCLEVGNVQIVVGSFRTQTFDEGPFVTAGVDWELMDIVALKSAQHFKGWWADKVETIIPCESHGVMTANIRLLDFTKADTNYYPLGDATWEEDHV